MFGLMIMQREQFDYGSALRVDGVDKLEIVRYLLHAICCARRRHKKQ